MEPNTINEAQIVWEDEESGPTIWNIRKSKQEDKESTLDIRLSVSGENGGDYDFTVPYQEFCYAVAKACTEAIKKHGIFGYYSSATYEEWNIRHVLYLKAVALNCLDWIQTKEDVVCYTGDASSFQKEMELLMIDM